MTKITVTGEVSTTLLNTKEAAELYDEHGKLLGRFIPPLDLSMYEKWEPEFDEEELRRREQSNEKRYTTAEVIKHLENL